MAGIHSSARLLDIATAQLNQVSHVQAWQGRKRFSETEDVQADVRAFTTSQNDARCWTWVEGRQAAGSYKPYKVTIGVWVLMKLETQTSSDCDDLYDMLDDIINALEDVSAFATVAANPIGVSWTQEDGYPEDDVAEFFLQAEFNIGFEGCAT